MRLRTLAAWLVVSLLDGSGARVDAQTAQTTTEMPQQKPLAIYIDCEDMVCDHDFFRTEIAFVTHLRERQDANVHILITRQPTAAGGSEATLNFIGQKEFAGVDDSLRYVSRPAATEDQVRTGLANAVKRGLVRYANRTSLSEDITIIYEPPATAASGPLRDPWHHWTFTTSMNGFVNGEELVKFTSLGVSASANRTTDDWKISTSAYTQYNRSTFELGDARSIASIQRSHAVTSLVARSVNDHLSLGGRASGASSSFLNQSLTLRLAPAVEYNLFPYRDSANRMFTVEYSVGVSAFDYAEETIFGKTSERLFDQRVLASLRLTQPWGSVTLAAEGSHYLDDLSKNRAISFGRVEWNLAKGLSVSTSLSFQRVRDQLFLPGRGASEEEILLRQRQLATSYLYSVSFGVSYTFGSRYANVVNRRFAGSVGGISLSQ